MKAVIDKARVPPGYFRYVCPESKVEIVHPYYGQCVKNAEAHRRANNYPIGSNWYEEVESNICANSNPDICQEIVAPSVWEQMTHVARALYLFAKSGLKTVDEPTFATRSETCYACEHWKGDKFFGTGGCAACGCSRIKLELPSEKCPRGKWPSVNP